VTAGAERASALMDWDAFMRQPAAYIDAARLAVCFDHQFSAELCGRLQGTGRLRDKLSTLINTHYALAAPVEEDAVGDLDRNIALSPVERLVDVMRRAGAIYWANAIASVLLAERVSQLHEQLGVAVCAFALANRDLSGPGEVLEPLADASVRVTEDGERCFAAWCQSLPDAVAARVRLKLPPREGLDWSSRTAPPDWFRVLACSIVQRAAAS
jgi:hypothetical protein